MTGFFFHYLLLFGGFVLVVVFISFGFFFLAWVLSRRENGW